jgi:hypothetical protein
MKKVVPHTTVVKTSAPSAARLDFKRITEEKVLSAEC